MEPLPPEALPAVPHVKFWLFDAAIPNLVVWGVLLVGFFVAAWARLPRFFEPRSGSDATDSEACPRGACPRAGGGAEDGTEESP